MLLWILIIIVCIMADFIQFYAAENMDSQLVDDVMVKFVMEIPRNATGKLMLKQLQQWANDID